VRLPRIPAIAGLALSGLGLAPALGSAVLTVEVADLGFAPAASQARVGDRIEWRNDDFIDHTATAEDGSWEVLLPAGERSGITLSRAGTILYYCRYHPQMKGRIGVEAN
jgi:plastocyanin